MTEKNYGKYIRPQGTDHTEDAPELEQYMELINHAMIDSMQIEDPDQSVNLFLRDLGEGLPADRTYIFELGASDGYENTYEWCAPGVSPEIAALRPLLQAGESSAWRQAFALRESYIISDVGEFSREDAQMSALLTKLGIHRLVVSPLIVEGKLSGFIGVDNPPIHHLHSIATLFQMAANYVAVLLRSRDTMRYIDEIANVDRLTGLQSLGYFLQSLWGLVDGLRREEGGRVLDVICFDLSSFKLYNRDLGYPAGDALLRRFGQVLRQLSHSRYVARSDADHFYVVVPEERAVSLVRQVHGQMRAEKQQSVHVRAGIYTLDPTDEGVSLAVERAKMAADAARGDYLNYYRRFSPEMEFLLERTNYLISHIDEAVEKGWIRTWYQPVANTFSGRICAMESLARWDDPRYGMLMPDAFIEPLERAHLLHRLDLGMLEHVCQDLKKHRDAGEDCVPVSVNFSRRDFEEENLHEEINATLSRYEVPPELIHVEITETALYRNRERMREHIRRFHEDGYQVWLDDFGSGYSSLNALQSFDLDAVKIDLLFLQEANEKTHSLLSSIVDMAKRLGMVTLTEGVETQQQYDFLHSIGCVMAQGFCLYRPAPLPEVLGAMRTRGLSFETASERQLYLDVGRVDVLDSSYQFLDVKTRAIEVKSPLGILVCSGEKVRLVYLNAAGKEVLRVHGYADLHTVESRIRSASSSFFRQLADCLAGADRPGAIRTMDFAVDGVLLNFRIQMISQVGELRAYLIVAVR